MAKAPVVHWQNRLQRPADKQRLLAVGNSAVVPDMAGNPAVAGQHSALADNSVPVACPEPPVPA